MAFTVRDAGPSDRGWIADFVRERWADTRIVVRGTIHDVLALDALIAETDGCPCGLATYVLLRDECEIITLDTVRQWGGIGTQLIERLADIAGGRGLRRLRLITTNDNLDALRFYQRREFVIHEVRVNAIEHSRRLKPSIPRIGDHGIPIRDEIELVRTL